MVVSESELLSPDFDVRLIPASEASRADADGGGAERKARPASRRRLGERTVCGRMVKRKGNLQINVSSQFRDGQNDL